MNSTIEILRGREQVPIDALADRTVAVIGYGNQGRAHAQNLRDSQISVIVGARRSGTAWQDAQQLGFDVCELPDAAAAAELVIIALPDEVQGDLCRAQIMPALKNSAVIGFLHGYSVRFGLIEPRADIGVVMVAPKGPGATLRELFTASRGLPALLAMHKDNARGNAEAIALAWAAGIGADRAGVIRTTFAAEAETDLFGEQAVLCGGLLGLVLAAFETLVESGYPAELAYLECCHEVKQVADLLYRGGLSGMAARISNTAEFGAYRAADRIASPTVRQVLRELLNDVQSGRFSADFQQACGGGGKEPAADGYSPQWLAERRQALAEHEIEEAGLVIRGLMPWLNE